MEENNAPQVVDNVQTTETNTREESTGGESSPVLGLRTDERTGRKIVETVNQPEAKTQETPKEEPQDQQQPQQPVQQPVAPTFQPTYYTPSEMTLAMQLGNVDEARIPPEYQPQYMAMKQKDAPPPKSEVELRNEFLDTVNKMAKEQALKDTGITQDEVDMGEFSDDEEVLNKLERYKTAVEINRSKIVSSYGEQMRIAQEKANQENAFKQDIANWIKDQQKQEPNFNEIGFFMQEHYKEMPYEKAAQIAPAVQKAMQGKLDPQSAEVVKGYYDECRKEFYARKNGTSVKPSLRAPSVERKGTGKDIDKPIDYAEQLRKASARDKTAIVSAWLSAMSNKR